MLKLIELSNYGNGFQASILDTADGIVEVIPLEKAKDLVKSGVLTIDGISPNGVVNVPVVNNHSSGGCYMSGDKGAVSIGSQRNTGTGSIINVGSTIGSIRF